MPTHDKPLVIIEKNGISQAESMQISCVCNVSLVQAQREGALFGVTTEKSLNSRKYSFYIPHITYLRMIDLPLLA